MRGWTVTGAALAMALMACGSKEDAGAAPPPPSPPAAVALPEVQGVPALEDENPDPNVVEVSIEATKTAIDIGGKQVSMLGYNGVVPGPMLKAKVGDEVIVHFHNALSQPTTLHWHGLRIPSEMDGSPRVQEPVQPGADFTYRFKVPDAGSFWYHPHVRANEQVEAGLYAPIVVFRPDDPTFDAERYVMLDDILLDANGKRPAPALQSMEGMHGRLGNTLLTNGRASSEARASAEQGMVERWRIVNTANARTMELEIAGASFRIIGTDGGLLPSPYKVKRLVVAIGQRFDVEVTYDTPGVAELKSMVMTVDANDQQVEKAFTVLAVDVKPSSRTPREIVLPDVTLPDRAPDTNAKIVLSGENGPMGLSFTLNGKAMPDAPLFTWTQGATVKMTLLNDTMMEHPFHLHGQFFTVLDKAQPGLKDTVLVPGMGTVQIVAYVDNPGRWMAHCHILEHAELGMMGEIVVTASGEPPPGEAPPMQH